MNCNLGLSIQPQNCVASDSMPVWRDPGRAGGRFHESGDYTGAVARTSPVYQQTAPGTKCSISICEPDRCNARGRYMYAMAWLEDSAVQSGTCSAESDFRT